MTQLATTTPGKNELSRSLKGRHLTMISIGGIIGAGLFVSSSTSIIAGGPASFISYAICGLLILLVMRMLGEMATALPHVRSFTEFARAGLGDGAGFVVGWLYWYFWVLVVPVEAIAGAKILQALAPAVHAAGDRHRPDGRHDRRQSHVGALLCRVRVLVCLHQGGRHHRVHRHRGLLRLRLDLAARLDLRQSRRPWRIHAEWLDRRACRRAHRVLRHDRRGNHHHCRGGVGAARARGRPHEQRRDPGGS